MTISVSMLIGLAVLLPLGGVLALWLYDERRFRRIRFVPTTDVLVTCEICLHQFTCSKDAQLPKCPQCGSLNEPPQS
jgi:hypothetical protein